MKHFSVFIFALILFLFVSPSSLTMANSYVEGQVTEEEIQELAEVYGWNDLRQPQNAFILPVDLLAEALYENFEMRNTNFTIEKLPLQPLQQGDTAAKQKTQIQQAVYYAVRIASRIDESIAYDLRNYKFHFKISNNQVFFIFQYNYGQTYEQVQYVNSEVKRIISTIIHPSMNIHEKIKTIHDYVVKNTAYDITMNQQTNTPFHALTNKKTLCSGYSQLTYLLLKEAGIEARIISGQSKGVDHAWNLVKVNNSWYHLDTTWNDPIPDEPGRVLYTYYMLPDKAMRDTHIWNDGGLNDYDLPYPRANSSYVSLLQKEGFYNTLLSLGRPITQVKTESELTNLIKQSVERYEPSLTVALPYGTLNKSHIENIFKTFLNEPLLSSLHYSYQESPIHFSHMNEATFYFYYTEAPTLTSLKWHGIHQQVIKTVIYDTLSFRLIATWDNGKQLDVTNFSDVTFYQSTNSIIRKNQKLYFTEEGIVDITGTYHNSSITHQIHVQQKIEAELLDDYHPLKQELLIIKDPQKTWTLLFNEPVNKSSHIVVRSLDTNENIPFSISHEEKNSIYRLLISPIPSWEKGKYVILLENIQSTQNPPKKLKSNYYFTFEVI